MMVEYDFYDIEVAKNFLSVGFRNFETGEITSFIIHTINGGRDDSKSLLKFLKNSKRRKVALIGYFNHGYDDLILRQGCYTEFRSTHHLYECSKWLIEQPEGHKRRINDLGSPFSFYKAGKDFFNKYYWKSLDLAKILNMDRYGKGLKAIAINLKYPNVEDLPFDPDAPIELTQVNNVLAYNINDVNITADLFTHIQSEVILRLDIEQEYGVKVFSASRTRIAKELFNKQFLIPEGLNQYDENLRTYRSSISIKDIIAPNIHFEHPNLIKLLEDLNHTHLSPNEEFSHKVEVGNKTYNVMRGGLHSVDKGGHYKSDEEYIILDFDVSSYYPMLMIKLNIVPEHLPSSFTPIMESITETRLKAKKEGNKAVAEALKIVVNATYGLLNEPHGFLYDPQCQLQVCINGELYLLMLIEWMENAGFEVLSANTDGVTVKVQRDKLEDAKLVAKGWESYTGFALETKIYLNMWMKDVNNYLMQVQDPKTGELSYKEKGKYVTESDSPVSELLRGYDMPVVSKAVREYLINGTDYVGYIKNHQDIYDFMCTKKSAKGMQFYIPSLSGDIHLQKHNRWVYSKHKLATLILKKKGNHKYRVASSPALIVNAVDKNLKIEDYKLDYPFYIKEAEKLLYPIFPDKFPKHTANSKWNPDPITQLGLF